ncbi:hypothetical protein BDA99DRAFT_560452 [Phascolomyces articulosus]|uniref:Uncharacterized protein n=1 Tax=Phascolomyces articulosus TaxID=60185 RepID=A0AAD5PF34_9FUNG|nr:hypothetical protein BDA99DRAFT_560452 [Phascolomyces articulosus]
MNTIEEQVITLIHSNKPVKETDIEALYDQLKPVDIQLFLDQGGSWKPGPFIETGHPGNDNMKALKWNGKDFESIDHVKPFMYITEEGQRINNDEIGFAVLRRMEYRGVVSTAMIYDKQPIIDYFRYVNDDLLLGAMDTKVMPKDDMGTLYFTIQRFKKVKSEL